MIIQISTLVIKYWLRINSPMYENQTSLWVKQHVYAFNHVVRSQNSIIFC
jgi:hypothetical protein